MSGVAVSVFGAEIPFWQRVADPHRERFEKLVREAVVLLDEAGNTGGARPNVMEAEAKLQEALKLVPDDFRALEALGAAQSMLGEPAKAVVTLERAREVARVPSREAECSFRLGIEKSKLGRFADALVDYDRRVRLAPVEDGVVHANSAEVLMGIGRLAEAQDRYREAIRLDEQSPADRRNRDHNLALGYYGLAVALDRDDQPTAAREAMANALRRDPKLSRLQGALVSTVQVDVFFVPDGDVHYYLGLAYEVAGRPTEAADQFRRFLSLLPASPWVRRAQAHVDALTSSRAVEPSRAAGGDRQKTDQGNPVLKVRASGTVRSEGPIPAPLIDAAWRDRPRLLDPCLDILPAPPREGLRVSLELEIDAAGVVTGAKAKLGSPGYTELAPCIESEVKRQLRVIRPSRPKPTRARMEILLGL